MTNKIKLIRYLSNNLIQYREDAFDNAYQKSIGCAFYLRPETFVVMCNKQVNEVGKFLQIERENLFEIVLFHECGHVQDYLNNKSSFIERIKSNEKEDVFLGEINAWKAAESIASDLKLSFDANEYFRFKEWQLNDYATFLFKLGA